MRSSHLKVAAGVGFGRGRATLVLHVLGASLVSGLVHTPSIHSRRLLIGTRGFAMLWLFSTIARLFIPVLDIAELQPTDSLSAVFALPFRAVVIVRGRFLASRIWHIMNIALSHGGLKNAFTVLFLALA